MNLILGIIFTIFFSGCGNQVLVKKCLPVEDSHYSACEKLGFWE